MVPVLNRIGYYLREGICGVFTHSLMSFVTICAIVSCLLLMGSFSLLALNINGIIAELEAQNQVVAYVDESLPTRRPGPLKAACSRWATWRRSASYKGAGLGQLFELV
jgi:cell division transport system permease protein